MVLFLVKMSVDLVNTTTWWCTQDYQRLLLTHHKAALGLVNKTQNNTTKRHVNKSLLKQRSC